MSKNDPEWKLYTLRNHLLFVDAKQFKDLEKTNMVVLKIFPFLQGKQNPAAGHHLRKPIRIQKERRQMFLDGFLRGALFVGTVSMILIFLKPRQYCPKCCFLLPRFRMPLSLKDAISGAHRCPECKCHIPGVWESLGK